MSDASAPAAPGRKLRLVYAAGPGDVIGTYRHWLAGHDDPTQVSLTYSGQFFDVCKKLGATALVIASCHRKDVVDDGFVRIEHRPIPFERGPGPMYHVGQVWWLTRLMVSAIFFRADAVVFAEGTGHWWLLGLLKWFGIAVIPSLHCAFWPAGFRPRGAVQSLVQRLNGRFWRERADATIAVSPECERQVLEIAPRPRGPIVQSRAQYARDGFDAVPPPDVSRRPFRVMYAGRIERDKGVFDVLSVADRLQRSRPGQFVWEICGKGSALDELKAEVAKSGLGEVFIVRGGLDRVAMLEAMGRSHAMIVPTTPAFAEGLNKVAVESILAGRPLVTSRLSNAIDVLGGAVLEVPPGDSAAMERAVAQLSDDPALFDAKRLACLASGAPFYDRTQGWAAALERAIRLSGAD